MTRRMKKSDRLEHCPQQLRLLMFAAEQECPKGHAAAFADLTAVALTKVPARGIFDPAVRGEHELFTEIERVAVRHLGMGEARDAWRQAVESARLDLEDRERLEDAAHGIQGASDTAYFYAGLAFGVVATCVFDSRT